MKIFPTDHITLGKFYIAVKTLNPGQRYLAGNYYWPPTGGDLDRQLSTARSTENLKISYLKIALDPSSETGVAVELVINSYTRQELNKL